MDKKKIILAIIAVIVIILAVGIYFVSTADVTLEGVNAQVTLPNSYTLDNKGVASNGTVDMYFTGIMEEVKLEDDFQKAVKTNGNSSGYENYTESTVNGFRVYEFAGNPKELKTLKYGSSTEWVEYGPEAVLDPVGKAKNSNHFREVTFISPNNSTVNKLMISTDDANVDLYTPEISRIIESIAVKSE